MEIIDGMTGGARIFRIVGADVIDVVGHRDFFDVVPVGFLNARVVLAEFLFGEETFLDAFEGAEFLVEIGDGFAAAYGFEEAGLNEAKQGFEVGFAMGLVIDAHGGSELAESFRGDGFGMVFGVEFAERGGTGGEAESAVGARFGELIGDVLVGEAIAEVEDEGLVDLGEALEHVEAFHK